MRKLFAFSAVTVAVGAALYAGIGYWAVPHYSRQILEETVAQKLGRTVTLDAVDFNPWTWVYEIRGLTIASRRGEAPLLELGLLRVDASAETITKMAPVLSELTIDGLKVTATVNDENIAELEKLTGSTGDAAPAAEASSDPGGIPAFAVYNISVKNSSFALVDTTRGIEERLTDVELALPFVSTMEAGGESLVTPKLSLNWNGTPVVAEGSTKPFGSTLEAQMRLKIDGLDGAPLARLVPDALPEGLTLASAKLSTDTSVFFRNATGGEPAAINVSGTTSLADVALTTGAGKTMKTPASLKLARVTLKSVDPTKASADVDEVLIRGVRVAAERNADGVGLSGAMPKAGTGAAAPAAEASSSASDAGSSAAWSWRLGRVAVEDVGVTFTDRTTAPAASLSVANLKAEVQNLASSGDPGKASFSMNVLGGSMNGSGTVSVSPVGGSFTLNASKLALAQISPYVKSVMGADLAGQFTMNMKAEGTPERVKLSGDASLANLALTKAGASMAAVKSASVKIASIDTGTSSAQIDRVNVTSADIRAVMTKAGLNFTEGLASGEEEKTDEKAQAQKSASTAPAWQWSVGTAELKNSRFSFRDETISPKGDAQLENVNVTVKNLSSKAGTQSVLDLSAGVGGGTLNVAGNFGISPVAASLDVEAQKVGLAPYGNLMRGYAGVGAKAGTVELRGRLGFADDVPSWKGDASLTSLDLVNAKGSGLMSWKSASLTGMDVAGGEPPRIIIARAEVDQLGEKQTETVRGALGLAGIVAQLAGKESVGKKIAKVEDKLSGSIVLENIRYVDGAFSAEGVSAASVGGILLQKLSESVGGKWLGQGAATDAKK